MEQAQQHKSMRSEEMRNESTYQSLRDSRKVKSASGELMRLYPGRGEGKGER
jgi:hypothetical protein